MCQRQRPHQSEDHLQAQGDSLSHRPPECHICRCRRLPVPPGYPQTPHTNHFYARNVPLFRRATEAQIRERVQMQQAPFSVWRLAAGLPTSLFMPTININSGSLSRRVGGTGRPKAPCACTCYFRARCAKARRAIAHAAARCGGVSRCVGEGPEHSRSSRGSGSVVACSTVPASAHPTIRLTVIGVWVVPSPCGMLRVGPDRDTGSRVAVLVLRFRFIRPVWKVRVFIERL